MRGSFTDSVCFSVLLAGLWCSRHWHCLCGVGHDLTPATKVCVCMCVYVHACGHVCGCIFGLVRLCMCGCVNVCGASGGLPARV